MSAPFVSADNIRTRFSRAMSAMYREEVPQYGALMQLVAEVNAETLKSDPKLHDRLRRADDLDRIDLERHGAIRVGTARELSTIRRMFAIMGMVAVGYYDLSVAGIPVHSTAFRPIDDSSLAKNPFRVFTSLLRLDLVTDEALRNEAESVLERRDIFTARALELIELHEKQGGFTSEEAHEFVDEALVTFRWHSEATVDAETYQRLSKTHRLIADVVSFKGPHINHLTPRTLDIDAAHSAMPQHGMAAKAIIEGPPRRQCPILLRQTSFKALEERIAFKGEDGASLGTHTARFGEIEQRGLALTRKGRKLYDELLASVRQDGSDGSDREYGQRLAGAFDEFPDDYEEMRRRGLGHFRYLLSSKGKAGAVDIENLSIDELVAGGYVQAHPIVYEDFLPVSAAGIFQSNLGGAEQQDYVSLPNKTAFLDALGADVHDEFEVYEQAENRSIQAVKTEIRRLMQSTAS